VVRAWCKGAKANLELLVDGLGAYRGSKSVSVVVKQYEEVPTVHGLRVGKPSLRHYVTKCRARAGEILNYEWGEGAYRLIEPGIGDPVAHSLRDEFDNHFSWLWTRCAKVALRQSTGSTKE
jgi:hypothetical protein